MNDDRTKVVGKKQYPDDYDNLYKDVKALEDDELAFLDEQRRSYSNQPENGYEPPVDDDYDETQQYDMGVQEELDYDSDDSSYRGHSGNKGHKKKKKKKGLIIGIIIAVLLIAAGIGGWLLMSGKTQEPELQPVNVDLAQTLVEPKVTGLDGEGVLDSIDLNEDEVDKILAGITNEEQAQQVRVFFQNVSYKADKTEKLSSGDKITITANYDEVIADEAKVTVTNGTYEYTVGKLEAKSDVDIPQWFKRIESIDSENVQVNCILLADEGTKITFPVGYTYSTGTGDSAAVIDTSGEPNLTYNGIGYYLAPGCEPAIGKVSSFDKSEVSYDVQMYGESFTINIEYDANDDGTINVTRASGDDAPILIGKYTPISKSEAKRLGAY